MTAKGTSCGIVTLGGVKTFPTSFGCNRRAPEPEKHSQGCRCRCRCRQLANTAKCLICSLEKVCRGKLTRPKKGLRFLQRLAFSGAARSPRTSVTQGPVSSHRMREREHVSFEKRVRFFSKSSFDYHKGGCCSLPASGLLFMSGAPTNGRVYSCL